MDEFINADEHRAEVSGLIQEVCSLKNKLERKEKQLSEKNIELLKNATADKKHPFDNPTDYKNYSGSYDIIQPRLGEAGYKIPVEIDRVEFKNLKRQYSIGSWCIMLQFVMSLILSLLLMSGVHLVMKVINGSDGEASYNYMYGSSILVAINMLVYIIANLTGAFAGLKWAGYKRKSLIKTRDFTFGKGLQYCFIALFLWLVSVYSGTVVELILNKFGLSSIVDQTGLGESPLGLAVGYVYTCIIAPVTEEIMFRGMVLKVFSRANQRFAIFASAFFFGLAHGNIPQFILAFILGIFLAQITMKHNSIVPAIVVHIFINTTSTVFGLVTDKLEAYMLIATLILFGAALVGAIMLLVFRSEGNRLPAPTPQQHRRGRAVATSSVPFMLAATIQIIYMIYALVA